LPRNDQRLNLRLLGPHRRHQPDRQHAPKNSSQAPPPTIRSRGPLPPAVPTIARRGSRRSGLRPTTCSGKWRARPSVPPWRSSASGWQALEDLADFPLERYPHDLFLPRIWELPDHVTTYDAAYLALAEALAAPLVTRDRALARFAGHTARIELV